MLDKELIKYKEGLILGYLDEIKGIKQMDVVDILRDVAKLRFFERNFQLIIDTILDINSHIISEENLGIPESYSNTFIILGQKNVLPMDFALKISNAVKLRNMVVHKYEEIDNKKMMQDLKDGIVQFEQYITLINKYLEK